MNERQFIYETLLHGTSGQMVEGRVLQSGALISGQSVKPYIVYTVGNSTDEGFSDPDSVQPHRQFFQVYIHDETGDYDRIDDIVRAVKNDFIHAVVRDNICGVSFLETSRDLDDPTLQTIMRYVRFQLAMAR
ncbi:hypothetical protein ACWIG4_30135 [Streptomyces sp. NPDC002248]